MFQISSGRAYYAYHLAGSGLVVGIERLVREIDPYYVGACLRYCHPVTLRPCYLNNMMQDRCTQAQAASKDGISVPILLPNMALEIWIS